MDSAKQRMTNWLEARGVEAPSDEKELIKKTIGYIYADDDFIAKENYNWYIPGGYVTASKSESSEEGGAQGVTGTQGATGAQGATGQEEIPAQGVTGTQGATGAQGATGQDSGAQGVTGQSEPEIPAQGVTGQSEPEIPAQGVTGQSEPENSELNTNP